MRRAARHPRRAPALRRPRAASSSTPRPGLSTATAPGPRVQRAARQPLRASARGSSGHLRPASRARASARHPRKVGEYNVLHVNLVSPTDSAGGKPRKLAGLWATAPQTAEIDVCDINRAEPGKAGTSGLRGHAGPLHTTRSRSTASSLYRRPAVEIKHSKRIRIEQ
jgi:hypothetical protein